MHDVLFDVEAFSGATDDYYNPANSYDDYRNAFPAEYLNMPVMGAWVPVEYRADDVIVMRRTDGFEGGSHVLSVSVCTPRVVARGRPIPNTSTIAAMPSG